MPSETILSATRPPFPTYLLPSLSFQSTFRPFRRRLSSTTTVSSTFSAQSLSSPTSPLSSANTTPSSSPPNPGFFGHRTLSNYTTSTVYEQLDEEDEADNARPRLGRVQPDTLKCSSCATDIAFASQIVSKAFTGRHGRAYLVSPPPQAPRSSPERSIHRDKDKNDTRDLINTKVGRPVNRQLVTGAHVVADISCVVCNSVIGWKYVDAKESAQRYKIGKFILETRRVVGGKTWEDVDSSEIGWDGIGTIIEQKTDNMRDVQEEEEVVFDSEDEDECEDLFSGVWDAESVKKRRDRRLGTRKQVEEA